MKLQQLVYVAEIVRRGHNLTATAEALHTSQPGISRQIQLLEAELGLTIFQRTRNRIIGLTEPGEMVYHSARRIVSELNALESLKEDFFSANRGTLTIATTHTQANYVLPEVIRQFVVDYPEVQIVLKQGDTAGICELVEAGDADLAIGTELRHDFANLVSLPCYELTRSVVVPEGHPLLDGGELTLEKIASYPVIMYGDQFSGYWKVLDAFNKAGLSPNVVMGAIDAGVCKTYVRLGLGIAILGTVSYNAAEDTGLSALDARDLFESSTSSIRLRPNTYLRPYLLDFIERFHPRLTPAVVREALESHGVATVGGVRLRS